MKKLIIETKHYIDETLNLPLKINNWDEGSSLPLLLQKSYDFYRSSLLNQEVLFCALVEDKQQTPSVLNKHHNLLFKKSGATIVFLFQSLSSYMRKKLIEQKISFIVPGNQLYLPGMGLDLRAHIINQRLILG